MKYWKHYEQDEFMQKTEYGLHQSIYFLNCNRDKKYYKLDCEGSQTTQHFRKKKDFLPVNDVILS